MIKFDVVTYVGMEVVVRGSVISSSQGEEPQRSPTFLEFASIYAYTL